MKIWTFLIVFSILISNVIGEIRYTVTPLTPLDGNMWFFPYCISENGIIVGLGDVVVGVPFIKEYSSISRLFVPYFTHFSSGWEPYLSEFRPAQE
jgi:hypothetical protein